MMAMTPGGLWWSTQMKPVRKKKKARPGKLKALSLSSSTSALSSAATATLAPTASVTEAPKEEAGQSRAASRAAADDGEGAAPGSRRPKKGPTGLHAACRIGLLDKVTELIAAGADVSARDASLNETPLHCAARRCHVGIARALLRAGADCSARTPYSELLASDLVKPPNRYSMVRELLQAAEADAARADKAAADAARRLKAKADKMKRAPAKDQSRGLSTHVNSLQAESCWVVGNPNDSLLSAPSAATSPPPFACF